MNNLSVKNKFCVLLTASINPYNKSLMLRNDPNKRESDYLTSLRLWLTKTNFKIVFCENTGYDLKKINELCNNFPERVEVIQFTLSDYSEYKDYGYGEFKIIEKAMKDSIFIKDSENVIKVTGRIFIENIEDIISEFTDDVFVNYTKHLRKDLSHLVHTILFIFKKDFFQYLVESSNMLKKVIFEDFFKHSINKARKNGFVIKKIKIFPKYIGHSGFLNKEYDELFIRNLKDLVMCFSKYIFKYVTNILIKNIGKIGKILNSKMPIIYKKLKPFFPDK